MTQQRATVRFLIVSTASISFCFVLTGMSSAAGPRVLPAGKLPDDARLDPPKDLDGYFPFTPYDSKREWDKRAGRLRQRLLVALGLWPMPTKTPLNAIVHGKIERDQYTVEKVFFESFPGFYVTGSLYRPRAAEGKRPVVLCPHGHWSNGRFHDAGETNVKRQIVQGAERFLDSGRSPLQARCVQLARLGCVVFHYDMIGYADSQQITYQLAHRFAKQRPEMNSPQNWGLFSPQAENHLQSVLGMQTYNSIRAIDFVTSLDDVDPSRIAVTGASGGGTQTMILCAIDPRPAVSVPAVMVSTAMQGGCTCENCSLLRVDSGNVEFAALFAPKPQAVTSADDWTREMAAKGFPELQAHYKMLGAGNNVTLISGTHFAHNYNYVTRAAMYKWLNKHLKLGHAEPIVEDDFQRLTTEEMSVWNGDYPAPKGGPDFERQLLKWWTEDTARQLAVSRPVDEKSLARYREIVGTGIDAVVGRELPAAEELEYEQTDKVDRGGHLEIIGLLHHKPRHESLPIVFLYPKQWAGRAVVWLDARGESGAVRCKGCAARRGTAFTRRRRIGGRRRPVLPG